jgi:mannosyltransferase OCH1-like enzyme
MSLIKTFNKELSIIWFQGEENIPKSVFRENLSNWRLLNPDWKINLIDEKILRNACKQYSIECLQIFDSFDLLHLKIDFGRYVLLYLNGGGYVDMDCYALRSLDKSSVFNEFINQFNNGYHRNILGLSMVNVDTIESFVFIGNSYIINNAIMFSSKNNPVLKNLIDTIIRKVLKIISCFNEKNFAGNRIISFKRFNNSIYSNIQKITGPYFLNKFIKKFINARQVNKMSFIKIFPHYIFEPAQPFGLADIQDETIAIHKFEMSWMSNNIKNMYSLYYKIKPYLAIIPIFLIVYLLTKRTRKK